MPTVDCNRCLCHVAALDVLRGRLYIVILWNLPLIRQAMVISASFCHPSQRRGWISGCFLQSHEERDAEASCLKEEASASDAGSGDGCGCYCRCFFGGSKVFGHVLGCASNVALRRRDAIWLSRWPIQRFGNVTTHQCPRDYS